MQKILSDQYFPNDPDAVYPLDNNLIVVGGEFAGQAVSDVVTQLELTGEDPNGDGLYSILDVLAPNENSVSEDIVVSNDYSVTLKDDGKLLYRWGNLSWLSLCPGSRISGGKVQSSRTRHIINRAAKDFRLAANALSRSQSANVAFFCRLHVHLGSPKAIIATAHKRCDPAEVSSAWERSPRR